EAYPPVLAMQNAAAEHRVPFLWDDDEVSVGYGRTARVWAAKAVPDPDDVDWASLESIPLGLVTGTNGKSTTVRMAAAIIRSAGLSAGLTSTDWIRVGEQVLDTGDYSGPGGARTLMRHADTEIAVLEVARGGLLRRGLGVETATAALITNVAADHLGEYGINTVQELAEAKFIVRKALKGTSPLILNADDSRIVEHSQALEPEFTEDAATRLIWFSLDADNPVTTAHLESGGRAACLADGWLELRQAGNARRIVKAGDLPSAFGGAARHNISNALAAMALCRQLGIGDDHLRQGLLSFRGDETDNPGRANWFEGNGVRIVVDFAHNAHGMRALAQMVASLDAGRRVLLMGQAGDRLDKDIEALTVAACAMSPDQLLICEMPGYERGREPGEVPAIIRRVALEAGVTESGIGLYPSPVEAVRQALQAARPGDMLVLLALTQREEVLKMVHEYIGDCSAR
ncbi:MAG: Mur ligase family protein, partial [Xanthomonadales bacterium]|nr:Mur ligase family protein [Xanthomonadales bacterium]